MLEDMIFDVGQLASARKAVKKGLELNLMIVGESGLGKTTLINTLLESKQLDSVVLDPLVLPKTVDIRTHSFDLDDKVNRIRLNMTIPYGFGDAVDSSFSVPPIVEFIENQLFRYFEDESGLNRRAILDTRIHCLLYMIKPDHRGLKALDIVLMKALHNLVNIFPLVAKADTYTDQELVDMKKKVAEDLNANQIKIYEFPMCDDDIDPEFIKFNEELKKLVPFSVIGGVEVVSLAGKSVRGRKYPWGFVEIDNPKNSEFPYLKRMLFRTHTHDLRDLTHEVHYENYRAKILLSGKTFNFKVSENRVKDKNITCDEYDDSIPT